MYEFRCNQKSSNSIKCIKRRVSIMGGLAMSGEYTSVFDIIGPVMIGPSSSHTAGAVAIGRVSRHLIGGMPESVRIDYYESFAKTHLGHGTDYAIVAGLLGLAPDDARVTDAVNIARQQGAHIEFCEEEGPSPINHPNTAVLHMRRQGQQMSVYGCSVGGGMVGIRRIRMNGYDLKLKGMLPLLLVEIPTNSASKNVYSEEQDPLVTELQKAGAFKGKSEYENEDGNGVIQVYDLSKPLQADTIQKLRRLASNMIYIN